VLPLCSTWKLLIDRVNTFILIINNNSAFQLIYVIDVFLLLLFWDSFEMLIYVTEKNRAEAEVVVTITVMVMVISLLFIMLVLNVTENIEQKAISTSSDNTVIIYLLFIMLSLFNAHNLWWNNFPLQKKKTHKKIFAFLIINYYIILVRELFNISVLMFSSLNY